MSLVKHPTIVSGRHADFVVRGAVGIRAKVHCAISAMPSNTDGMSSRWVDRKGKLHVAMLGE